MNLKLWVGRPLAPVPPEFRPSFRFDRFDPHAELARLRPDEAAKVDARGVGLKLAKPLRSSTREPRLMPEPLRQGNNRPLKLIEQRPILLRGGRSDPARYRECRRETIPAATSWRHRLSGRKLAVSRSPSPLRWSRLPKFSSSGWSIAKRL
jgi:hypothetical protein